MSRPTVLLFDIDGTLVTTGGAGRRALELAFGRLHGREDALRHFPLDGMTDRSIVREGLRHLGVECTAGAIDGVLGLYVRCLEEAVAAVPDGRYRVHPGMEAAILAAHQRGMAVGLGTGNIREGARVKLERVGLFRHFAFGGFGDDHELRPELIRAGALRGARALGHAALEAVRVVVIGDTPKDVAAAVAIGAESVGVGTGSFRPQALTEAGATHAFDTLASPGALEAVLGLGTPRP
jgi:phosphoglycolate phosphatase-like HAD superfamily hydrolase